MHETRVLILNRGYVPVRLTSWQRAFCLLSAGRAEMVEAHQGREIRSAESSWPWPSIVRMTRGTTRLFRVGPKLTRRNVYLRDEGSCQYCGCKVSFAAFTLDHVIPKSRGGRADWSNLVTSCRVCNQKKGNRLLSESNHRLIKQPQRPKRLAGADGSLTWHQDMPACWRDYLGH